MARYSQYKDSGELWLGQIPSHWEMKRWRFLMEENTAQNTKCAITNQLQFKYGDIVQKANQSIDDDVLKNICKYTVVRPNDIMINGLNLNYDFISQRVGQVQEDGVITSAYISLRPTGLANQKYLVYLLKAMDALKLFHGMGTGVRLTLSYKELRNKYLPLPSADEQNAMVAYLDKATSQIDEAIDQQQKMIDLLNERKQIIIHKAVTKGLDPKAPMKDSGVEWIGLVPFDWNILSLKYCIKLNNGKDFKLVAAEDGYPVMGSGGQFAYASEYMYDGEVIFFGRKGTVDKPLHYIGKFWAVDTMFYATPKTNCFGRYIYYQALTIPYKYYATSTAIPSMTQTDLGNNPICLPPLTTQKEISEYLDQVLLPIEESISLSNKKIDLLRERKQIIINEVVTGKVKVI